MPITKEEITAVFLTFLDRRPSDVSLRDCAVTENVEILARRVLQSPEFLNRLTKRFYSSMPNGLRSLTDDRIVYLHIPKCGGTTLHHMLEAWYGADAVHRERFNGLYYWSASNLASKSVFSGHYDFYSTQLVPGRPKLISFLRDPRERLISLYNFHRAHRTDAADSRVLIRWANTYDIDAYFANDEVRANIAVNNSMARFLSDVPQVNHRWDGTGGPRVVPIEEMTGQAIANIQRFDFIGFMDRYDASIDQLAAQLGKPRPAQLERRQVLDDLMETNPGMRPIEKQRPSAGTLAQMDDLVRFDDKVYAAAQHRFNIPMTPDLESDNEQ